MKKMQFVGVTFVVISGICSAWAVGKSAMMPKPIGQIDQNDNENPIRVLRIFKDEITQRPGTKEYYYIVRLGLGWESTPLFLTIQGIDYPVIRQTDPPNYIVRYFKVESLNIPKDRPKPFKYQGKNTESKSQDLNSSNEDNCINGIVSLKNGECYPVKIDITN